MAIIKRNSTLEYRVEANKKITFIDITIFEVCSKSRLTQSGFRGLTSKWALINSPKKNIGKIIGRHTIV
jgi:hypothetical protein